MPARQTNNPSDDADFSKPIVHKPFSLNDDIDLFEARLNANLERINLAHVIDEFIPAQHRDEYPSANTITYRQKKKLYSLMVLCLDDDLLERIEPQMTGDPSELWKTIKETIRPLDNATLHSAHKQASTARQAEDETLNHFLARIGKLHKIMSKSN